MITDLEGKNSFHYLDPLYIKYFVTKKVSLMEQEKLSSMRSLIRDFTQKVYDENTNVFTYNKCRLGYLQDYGYYLLANGDRGFYYIENFGLDENLAFKNIIIELLLGLAIDYEMYNRTTLYEDFAQRFAFLNIEYGSDIYFAEYCLRMLNKYYDNNIPQDIICYFENYLNAHYNSQSINWKYNPTTLKFESLQPNNTRTLKKDDN